MWQAYFEYYTVQDNFDRYFAIIDLYEKERGGMYALCSRVKNKYDKLNKDKDLYLAKFIESNLLLEDADAVGHF